jgi:hypothetical protein
MVFSGAYRQRLTVGLRIHGLGALAYDFTEVLPGLHGLT